MEEVLVEGTVAHLMEEDRVIAAVLIKGLLVMEAQALQVATMEEGLLTEMVEVAPRRVVEAGPLVLAVAVVLPVEGTAIPTIVNHLLLTLS